MKKEVIIIPKDHRLPLLLLAGCLLVLADDPTENKFICPSVAGAVDPKLKLPAMAFRLFNCVGMVTAAVGGAAAPMDAADAEKLNPEAGAAAGEGVGKVKLNEGVDDGTTAGAAKLNPVLGVGAVVGTTAATAGVVATVSLVLVFVVATDTGCCWIGRMEEMEEGTDVTRDSGAASVAELSETTATAVDDAIVGINVLLVTVGATDTGFGSSALLLSSVPFCIACSNLLTLLCLLPSSISCSSRV